MEQHYKIFTWPVYPQYLQELAQGDFEIYIPEGQNQTLRQQFINCKNIIEVSADAVKNLPLNCIIFQDEHSYLARQHTLFSDQQREIAKVYVEHQPPKQHPTNAKHVVDDLLVRLVHVNHYNALMWDNNQTPVTVIENGVKETDASFTGKKPCGVVVFDENSTYSRVTGLDIFEQIKEALPLEVMRIGQDNVTYQNLPEKLSSYRFLFCPDRYASPGFPVKQAMMIGIPVVGLATTNLPTIISNEVSGFVHSDLQYLIQKMQQLIENLPLAVQLGANARLDALKNFTTNRFLADWTQVIDEAVAQNQSLLTKI